MVFDLFDWSDESTFSHWHSKLTVFRQKVDETFAEAEADWARQKTVREAEDLDPDSLWEASEMGRLLEIAFFNLLFSHFERTVSERYESLREKIPSLPPSEEAVFAAILSRLEMHLPAGTADFARTKELHLLRNRLLHDGAKWTDRTDRLQKLIAEGDLFKSLTDDVALTSEGVDRAVGDLQTAFLGIAAAVRDYQSG